MSGLLEQPYCAVVRDGAHVVVATDPVEVVTRRGRASFDALDALSPGWWAGFLSYDLGRAVERVIPRTVDELSLPDLLLVRFQTRTVVDAPRNSAPPVLGPGASSLDRSEFEARVDAILELIRAGDCYQANLTRQLRWDRRADPVALYAALHAHRPTLFRTPDVAVVSASPERFLTWNGRDVETRPIKGTAARPGALSTSAKDHAENVMIVDLARNDLGRVCIPGSISVPTLCAEETHPGLQHLVSTVRGRVRDDVGIGSLVRATFPPASVTGAPKPRVLQIIEDLEPVRRGVYCGAVGWIDTDNNRGDLAVAIRTFTLTPDATFLGVGAGIVADSDPGAEWEETELKAARFLQAVGAGSELIGLPA